MSVELVSTGVKFPGGGIQTEPATASASGAQIFTSSGTWNYTAAGSPDKVLVYVQGAGGSKNGPHPGWAGSVAAGSGGCQIQEVTVSGNVTVTVGSGGSYQYGYQRAGNSGGSSRFGSVTGGGGGGANKYTAGSTGSGNAGHHFDAFGATNANLGYGASGKPGVVIVIW